MDGLDPAQAQELIQKLLQRNKELEEKLQKTESSAPSSSRQLNAAGNTEQSNPFAAHSTVDLGFAAAALASSLSPSRQDSQQHQQPYRSIGFPAMHHHEGRALSATPPAESVPPPTYQDQPQAPPQEPQPTPLPYNPHPRQHEQAVQYQGQPPAGHQQQPLPVLLSQDPQGALLEGGSPAANGPGDHAAPRAADATSAGEAVVPQQGGDERNGSERHASDSVADSGPDDGEHDIQQSAADLCEGDGEVVGDGNEADKRPRTCVDCDRTFSSLKALNRCSTCYQRLYKRRRRAMAQQQKLNSSKGVKGPIGVPPGGYVGPASGPPADNPFGQFANKLQNEVSSSVANVLQRYGVTTGSQGAPWEGQRAPPAPAHGGVTALLNGGGGGTSTADLLARLHGPLGGGGTPSGPPPAPGSDPANDHRLMLLLRIRSLLETVHQNRQGPDDALPNIEGLLTSYMRMEDSAGQRGPPLSDMGHPSGPYGGPADIMAALRRGQGVEQAGSEQQGPYHRDEPPMHMMGHPAAPDVSASRKRPFPGHSGNFPADNMGPAASHMVSRAAENKSRSSGARGHPPDAPRSMAGFQPVSGVGPADNPGPTESISGPPASVSAVLPTQTGGMNSVVTSGGVKEEAMALSGPPAVAAAEPEFNPDWQNMPGVCNPHAEKAKSSRRRLRQVEVLLAVGLLREGDMVTYKSRSGKVMAQGTVKGTGILCSRCSQLVGATEFEQCAGSGLRRPCENIYTADDTSLQDLLVRADKIMLERAQNVRYDKMWPAPGAPGGVDAGPEMDPHQKTPEGSPMLAGSGAPSRGPLANLPGMSAGVGGLDSYQHQVEAIKNSYMRNNAGVQPSPMMQAFAGHVAGANGVAQGPNGGLFTDPATMNGLMHMFERNDDSSDEESEEESNGGVTQAQALAGPPQQFRGGNMMPGMMGYNPDQAGYGGAPPMNPHLHQSLLLERLSQAMGTQRNNHGGFPDRFFGGSR